MLSCPWLRSCGFASRRRLDRSPVLPEPGFTRARHERAIGAAAATCRVGLRRSLARSCPIPVSFRKSGRKPTPSFSTQSFNSSLRTSKATSTRPDLPLGKACLIAFVTSSLTIRPSDGDPLIPDAATAKARMIGLCQEGTSCGSPTSMKAESRWR